MKKLKQVKEKIDKFLENTTYWDYQQKGDGGNLKSTLLILKIKSVISNFLQKKISSLDGLIGTSFNIKVKNHQSYTDPENKKWGNSTICLFYKASIKFNTMIFQRHFEIGIPQTNLSSEHKYKTHLY